MRLLRGVWKLLVGIKDALVLILLLIFFAGLSAALSASPDPGPTDGALRIAIDGSLVEQPAETRPLGALLGRAPVTQEYRLRDVVRAIEGAADDPSIKAVVLDLDRFIGGSQAAIAAATEAVDRARAKKPVLAFATGYSDDGYQLASHASEIWLDPLGAVMFTGPGGSRLYYKGLLDKLGVETKVYRVGTFKSAVEPYTRNDQSPEARAANQALADTLWARWQEEVARARPGAKLAAYIAAPEQAVAAAGGDIAKAAVAAGLVDQLGDRIAFERRVAALAGPGKPGDAQAYRAVALDGWLDAHAPRVGGDAIGVLTVAGEIVDGTAGPGTAGGDTIANLLIEELQRKRIKALVVRVDSPGGSVLASERIRRAIMEAKRQKLPVVVSMGGLAASGGYWISTPADMIFADPATITGSIGVFGLLPTFKGSLAKLGLGADGVRTTPLSGEPDIFNGTSPSFDALMQSGIDGIYTRFTGLVASSRKLPPARVDQIGQGRVWAGATARQLGLVDRFGGLDDAIAEAARRARLDPAKVSVRDIEKAPSRFAQLFDRFARRGIDAAGPPRDLLTRLARAREADLVTGVAGLGALAEGPVVQVRCLECPLRATAAARIDWRTLLLARLGLR